MTLKQGHVPFGGSVIDYRIERSDRRRTVTIAVDPSAGVVLKAPADATMRRLDDVVKTKAPGYLQRLAGVPRAGPGADAQGVRRWRELQLSRPLATV